MTAYLGHLPFTTGPGLGARGRIGLIALASEYSLDHEFREVLAHTPDVALYTTRVSNDPVITPSSLAAMEAGLTGCADLLLKDDTIDVVAYGCTSASMIIGPERVADRIHAAKPGAAVVTPITAVLAAFRRFAALRVGVLTPYTADVNAGIQQYLETSGYTVPVFGSFDEPDDRVVSAIDGASLRAAVLRLAEHDVDAVFVSCTSIRILDQIAALEAEIGRPVTSSNQALIRSCLDAVGVVPDLPAFGRLMTASV